MSLEVWGATLDWVVALGLPLVLLSGGEPTEHPEILELLRLARQRGVGVLLTSNGMFLHESGDLRDEVLELVKGVQVTNDPRFYPQRVEDFEHPKVVFERQLRMLSPFGRAIRNGLVTSRVSPLCFNLRSATRGLGSFREALATLYQYGKFCCPSVNVDGAVVAGEAPSCSVIGKVGNSDTELTGNVTKLRCVRCGLVDNLTGEQRAAVGE